MKSLFPVAVICALLATSPAWAKRTADPVEHTTLIRDISLQTLPEADVVHVRANGPIPRWHNFSFKKHDRILVLDLYDCDYKGSPTPEAPNGRFIHSLRFGRHPGKVRIAANLIKPTGLEPQVRKTDDGIALYVARRDSAVQNDCSTPPLSEAHLIPPPSEARTILPSDESPTIPLSNVAPNITSSSAAQIIPPLRGARGVSEHQQVASNLPQFSPAPPESGAPSALKLDNFDFEGKLWNKFAHDTQEDNRFEDEMCNHFKFRFGARYTPYDNLYTVLSVDFDHFAYYNDNDWNTDEDVRFYESYINYSGPRFNLRAGNQIVRWGKTDGYSPLDNVSPEDLRDGLASRREERKLAIPMVNLELYKGTYALQGIVIPYFVPSELDLFGTDWALFDHLREEIGPFAVNEEDVPKNFSNIEYGIRFSGIVRNIDYAFSYLHARTDIPSLVASGVPLGFPIRFSSIDLRELTGFALATGQTIQLQYDRQNVFGIEFETTVHNFGLRGDFAYVYRGSFLQSDLSRIKKPLFQYMIGADYNGPWNSYFLLQFSQSIVQNYDDDIISTDEIANAVNGTISKDFLYGKFKPELRFFYDLNDGMYLVNPKLLIKYWDFFSLEIGAEFFGGPADSLLGLYTNNDQIYTILEIPF